MDAAEGPRAARSAEGPRRGGGVDLPWAKDRQEADIIARFLRAKFAVASARRRRASGGWGGRLERAKKGQKSLEAAKKG